MNKKIIFCTILCQLVFSLRAEDIRIDPSFWWTGMKNQELQLCVHGKDIALSVPTLNYAGVLLVRSNRVENPNYLFLDLQISDGTLPGKFTINFKGKSKNSINYTYELKARSKQNGDKRIQGITNKDFIYLLMPDRFSNGDISNDILIDKKEEPIDRKNLKSRHGGDIQGVINHLDYIKSLGATAIWMTPVTENRQRFESYHGYAITDHYKIDPRQGSNELYLNYVDKAHTKGLKIVMDVVYNHIGNEHWFYKDLPSKDWVHTFNKFTRTTYKDMVLFDPHASDSDRNIMSDGWFDKHMPDLNQKNPYLAKYLIQNTIWWIEYAGVDGLRIDTWAYPDLEFENVLITSLLDEYPQLGIFGETWVQGIANQSYFVQNNYQGLTFQSKLPAVTDFQLYYATQDALTTPFGWESGTNRWYRIMANDFVYKDPSRNVLFLDNHDLSRFYSVVKEDYNKWKIGIAFLLTSRGIPSIYTGTEYLSHNFASLSAIEVREDFPGGFPSDSINKFKAEGRSKLENEAFDYISGLANYRKNSSALTTGKLMQYVPQEGEYIYFRYNEKQSIMILLNPVSKEIRVDTKRYCERIENNNYKSGINILTGEKESFDDGEIILKPNSVMILELQH
jgi:glycosidase